MRGMNRDDRPLRATVAQGDAEREAASGAGSLLALQGVGKSWGDVVGVRDVDLAVEKGSRTVIVGPSGSGKTTLLRIIAGFEAPDAGTLRLEGQLLADAVRAVPAHARAIGFVPQDGALFPHLSVEANVGFGLALPPAARAAEVRALLDLVALDHGLLKRWPHELSGGQQQRVALARALARRPSLMLLDEPFSALDTDLRADTRKAIAGLLAREGITTVLVTHDRAEALSFADRVAVMRNGRLVQAGRPEELYWRPRDEGIARFLGDAILLPAEVDAGVARTPLGPVAVDGREKGGRVTVMLRPEQVEIVAATADGAAGGLRFVVLEAEFGGTLCSVSLAPVDAAQGEVLRVRCFGHRLPSPGMQVQARVVGQAHVLTRD